VPSQAKPTEPPAKRAAPSAKRSEPAEKRAEPAAKRPAAGKEGSEPPAKQPAPPTADTGAIPETPREATPSLRPRRRTNTGATTKRRGSSEGNESSDTE
jgi:hypothetical protein